MLPFLFGIIIHIQGPQYHLPQGIYNVHTIDSMGWVEDSELYFGINPLRYYVVDQNTGDTLTVKLSSDTLSFFYQDDCTYILFYGKIVGDGKVVGYYTDSYFDGVFTMEFSHER